MSKREFVSEVSARLRSDETVSIVRAGRWVNLHVFVGGTLSEFYRDRGYDATFSRFCGGRH